MFGWRLANNNLSIHTISVLICVNDCFKQFISAGLPSYMNLHCQLFPTLHPLFEQIFVVTVTPSAQRDGPRWPEVPRVGVDEDGHQTLSLGQSVDVHGHLVDRILWLRKSIILVNISYHILDKYDCTLLLCLTFTVVWWFILEWVQFLFTIKKMIKPWIENILHTIHLKFVYRENCMQRMSKLSVKNFHRRLTSNLESPVILVNSLNSSCMVVTSDVLLSGPHLGALATPCAMFTSL